MTRCDRGLRRRLSRAMGCRSADTENAGGSIALCRGTAAVFGGGLCRIKAEQKAALKRSRLLREGVCLWYLSICGMAGLMLFDFCRGRSTACLRREPRDLTERYFAVLGL